MARLAVISLQQDCNDLYIIHRTFSMYACDWAKLLNYIIDINLFDKRHSSREF